MKKIVTVSIAIIFVVALVLLVPRVGLQMMAKSGMESFKGGEMITDYETKPEKGVSVGNEYIKFKLPQEMTQAENKTSLDAYVIKNNTGDKQCVLINKMSDVTISLVDEAHTNEEGKKLIKRYGASNVENAYESMGYPVPDSYYNIMKCMTLLDYEDFDFLSMRKAQVFVAMVELRKVIYQERKLYVYERDDVCAFVQERSKNQYAIEFFEKNDLNTVCAITMKTQDFDDIKCILNTVEFK